MPACHQTASAVPWKQSSPKPLQTNHLVSTHVAIVLLTGNLASYYVEHLPRTVRPEVCLTVAPHGDTNDLRAMGSRRFPVCSNSVGSENLCRRFPSDYTRRTENDKHS